jgi:hypothetical protein
MADYLVQEDGTSRLLEEDGTGSFLLETGEVDPPFISSVTAVYTLGLVSGEVDPSFIASVAAVYTASLHGSSHFVGTTVAGASSGSSFTVVSLPTGVQDGDLMIAVFTDNMVCTGWTQIAAIRSIYVLVKVASSEPSSYTFSQGSPGATARCAGIMVYRGPISASPDAIGTNTSSAVGPTLTPTTPDDLEIHIVQSDDPTGLSATSGFTTRSSVTYFTLTGLFVQDRTDYASTSATGTITPVGSTGTSPDNIHILFRASVFQVDPGFIPSTTTLYSPDVTGRLDVSFIASATQVYALTLPQTFPPFITSQTRVFGVFSLFTEIVGTGPGNGGETVPVRLAPNGTSVTTTLAASITATDTLLELTSTAGLPATDPFVLTIDAEIVYVVAVGAGAYRVRSRGVGNTTPASHLAAASATWGDSYDMAIAATADIAASFTANVNGSGSHTYPGWLICFDSSQAYLSGSRYPMHVTEVVGVFDAGAGTTGTNRLDASQPNAIATAVGASDDCPAALSNPARISSSILTGDVAVIRYTNAEASTLDLGPRSAALQSWFGMKRVDNTDTDVTLTDPTGHVVDTNPGTGPYTGSVNGEWTPPVLGPAIGPDTGLPTSHDVPYTSVTLPGADRYFTDGIHFSEKGWPIACLAVRQGDRRIPFWRSWDWHDFNYVYAGFGTDDTYAQLLINRNGMIFGGSDPTVALPGSQDIDGPNAVWDDGSYYFGASWYVAIWAGPYLVVGPSIGGTASADTSNGPVPSVDFSGGVGSPTVTVPTPTGPPPVEGGSGGGVPAGSGGDRFEVAHV